jgi:hypothetical protein
MPTTTFTEVINATGGLQISGSAVPSLGAANTFTLAQTIAGGTTATDLLNLGADTNLYRSAANEITTDDRFRINAPSGSAVFLLKTTGRQYSFFLETGTHDFGVYNENNNNYIARYAGTGAYAMDFTIGDAFKLKWSDVNLYRSAADELATDDIMRFNAAGTFQTTVGAAGAASAPPATPTKYLKVKDEGGTTYVVPCYAAA